MSGYYAQPPPPTSHYSQYDPRAGPPGYAHPYGPAYPSPSYAPSQYRKQGRYGDPYDSGIGGSTDNDEDDDDVWDEDEDGDEDEDEDDWDDEDGDEEDEDDEWADEYPRSLSTSKRSGEDPYTRPSSRNARLADDGQSSRSRSRDRSDRPLSRRDPRSSQRIPSRPSDSDQSPRRSSSRQSRQDEDQREREKQRRQHSKRIEREIASERESRRSEREKQRRQHSERIERQIASDRESRRSDRDRSSRTDRADGSGRYPPDLPPSSSPRQTDRRNSALTDELTRRSSGLDDAGWDQSSPRFSTSRRHSAPDSDRGADPDTTTPPTTRTSMISSPQPEKRSSRMTKEDMNRIYSTLSREEKDTVKALPKEEQSRWFSQFAERSGSQTRESGALSSTDEKPRRKRRRTDDGRTDDSMSRAGGQTGRSGRESSRQPNERAQQRFRELAQRSSQASDLWQLCSSLLPETVVTKSRVGRKLVDKFPKHAEKYLSRCETTDGQTLGKSLGSGRASEATQSLTVNTIGSQLLDTFRRLETQDLTTDKNLSKSDVETRVARLAKYIDSAKSDLSRMASFIGSSPPTEAGSSLSAAGGGGGGGGGDEVFVPGEEVRYGARGEKITIKRQILELDKSQADKLFASGMAVRAADNLRIAPSISEVLATKKSAAVSTDGGEKTDVSSFVLDHWKKQMGRYLSSTS